ncbi:transcriptional regulator, TetR family [Shimia gijangensis]|uniref:Transcriptional regulator, TetR family n=1 Tax=Shimia gijangensis TaxID=1470563 RepID=A0A1M6DC14_9RHOB|nr:TetR/AcrR family transcriptional regulator [Shimia gijangensis]SHI70568.1 transcriptional regulator, TetR family [Shimia gijangensis]
MEKPKNQRASRKEWLLAATDVLNRDGVDKIKVVSIARELNLTSGSFYWHFRDVQDLLQGVLDHWENALTANIIDDAQAFTGEPKQRILNLMCQVIREDAARTDAAIKVWSRRSPTVEAAFSRVIASRFSFAKWMFEEAGFSESEAAIRGRMMVAVLMGEALAGIAKQEGWEDIIRDEWSILTN